MNKKTRLATVVLALAGWAGQAAPGQTSEYFVLSGDEATFSVLQEGGVIRSWGVAPVASITQTPVNRLQAQDSHRVDAQQALQRLRDGNARFVAGKSQHPHESPDWRRGLEAGQHPFAVVLGCSDSRVPPELVFDQGLGDLFVVRVGGNVVDTDVTASIEYAVDHLGTELVVVMGHTSCGAVTATLDNLVSAEGEPAEVLSLLYLIEPATVGISADLPHQKRVEQAVKRNVELAVRRLSRVPDLRRSVKAGKLEIVGAIYDMHTGKVNVLK